MTCNMCRKLLISTTYRSLFCRRLSKSLSTSSSLTNAEIRKKRNEIFDEERQRQLSHIRRIEKIKVEHKGPPEDCSLIMNKNLSTPFNCAMHIQELLMTRSALALVNGEPWDMHRPLVEDCELSFLHFRDEDPRLLNNTFWRSCSFILGHVMETAFKEKYPVNLVSFPRPNVASGSFVYDVDLQIPDWKPSTVELNCLGRIGFKLRQDDLRFQRLEVDASVAKRMFEDNPHKSQQIPQIAAQNEGSRVTLYCMGDHIDISRGPLIASTSHIGRFNVTAVHGIECPERGPLKRVQGLALPTQVKMHYWSYEILTKRAAKQNPAPMQSQYAKLIESSEQEQMIGQ